MEPTCLNIIFIRVCVCNKCGFLIWISSVFFTLGGKKRCRLQGCETIPSNWPCQRELSLQIALKPLCFMTASWRQVFIVFQSFFLSAVSFLSAVRWGRHILWQAFGLSIGLCRLANVLTTMSWQFISIIYLSIRWQSFRLVSTPFLLRAFAYRADNRIFLTVFLPKPSILLWHFL